MSLSPGNRRIPDPPAVGGLFPDTDMPDRDLFRLSGPVGRGGANARADVIKAQILLGNAGYYDLAGLGAPTGWAGAGLERAIRQYQKDNGLAPDGVLLPLTAGRIDENGVGETLAALQDRLGGRLAGHVAPTPAEIDAHHAAQVRGGTPPGGMPAIVTADMAGRDGYPVGVLSDAVAAAAMPPRQGQQVAQMALPANMVPPPAGSVSYGRDDGPEGDTAASPSPYPQDAPPVKALAREIDRRLGYANDNLRSLLDAAGNLQQQGRQSAPGADPARRAAFVTQDLQPHDEAAKKGAKTPPLSPPAIDDRLQGRPAETPNLPDEKLVPTEIRDWYEGLEPFDQELAKELLLVFINTGGRRGIEATRLGTADMVKELLDYFEKQRTDIPGQWDHVFGSRKRGDGDELREEYIRGRDSDGPKGATWPDATIQYLAKGLEPEYLRLFTGKTLKGDPRTGIKAERDQLARAEYNKPGEMMAFAPKLLADRPDGAVSPETRAAYREIAKTLAAEIGLRFEALLKTKGKL